MSKLCFMGHHYGCPNRNYKVIPCSPKIRVRLLRFSMSSVRTNVKPCFCISNKVSREISARSLNALRVSSLMGTLRRYHQKGKSMSPF